MVSYHRTEGFVFKEENTGEADRVFSIFTRDFGRVEVFGKSIRKISSKLRGGIDIFSLSEVEFVQGKHRKTLIETAAAERFYHIKNDVHRFKVASHIADLLDHFLRGEEKDQKIWELLHEVWKNLDGPLTKTRHQTLLYYYFFWNFVSALGYKPELARCVSCINALDPLFLHFSLREGGLLCKNCLNRQKNGIRVSAEAVKVLRLLVEGDQEMLFRLKLDGATIQSLKSLSKQYMLYLVEHPDIHNPKA